MSKISAVTLPPEIWAVVIRHLLRRKPPSGREYSWSKLHQEDLASCARVCKSFHDITIPILYEEPLFDDLGGFLFPCHLTRLPPGHPMVNVMRKIASLKHVRKLHINYPIGNTYGTYFQIFNDLQSWGNVTKKSQKSSENLEVPYLLGMYSSIFDSWMSISPLIRNYFPRIQSISLNGWGPQLRSQLWETISLQEGPGLHDPLSIAYHQSAGQAHQLLAIENTPQSICTRGVSGPINIAPYHVPPQNGSIRPLRIHLHQVDHYSNHQNFFGQHLQVEYTNFVAEDPLEDHDLESRNAVIRMAIDINEMAEGVKVSKPGATGYWDYDIWWKDVSRTRIEHYGFYQKAGMDEKRATEFAEMLQMAFDAHARIFKGKFLFYPLHAVPKCDSCGYEIGK